MAKKCTGCGGIFPATNDFFHNHKAGKHGLRSKCRGCRAVERRERYAIPEVRERELGLNKAWVKENPEKVARIQKKYRSKPEAKARRNEGRRNRYANDEDYRILETMRARFAGWFKTKGVEKGCSFSDVVDYTQEELWKHLESKFEDGMARGNHGEWHIDHIIPLNSFDPKCWMQMSVAWDLNNLQPLWASDNCSKGTKLDWSKR